MSSINPVFLLPGAVEERGDEIAGELFRSCLLGTGQFCTKPGLVVLLKNEKGESFLRSLKSFFDSSLPGFLLGRTVMTGLTDAVRRLENSDAALVTGGRIIPSPGLKFEPTLFRISGENFIKNPDAYQVESFGALSIIVFARNFSEMKGIAARLGGQLTGTICSRRSGEDDSLYDELEPLLRLKAGRLTNDKMPTGVTVSPAMVHGGPFPAAGHPGFTSVGIPASLLRFASLQCYDGVRSHRLPPELRDRNPTGRMWRSIDGEWTRRSLP
jgi:NADP-dependent aldehyde dehydrogenase